MCEAQRRVAGDSTLTVNDLGDAISRHAKLPRKLGRQHTESFQPLGEHFTGMMCGCVHRATPLGSDMQSVHHAPPLTLMLRAYESVWFTSIVNESASLRESQQTEGASCAAPAPLKRKPGATCSPRWEPEHPPNSGKRRACGSLPRLRVRVAQGCAKLPERTAPRGASFERGERLEDFRCAHVLLIADIGGMTQDRECRCAILAVVHVLGPQAEVRHPS